VVALTPSSCRPLVEILHEVEAVDANLLSRYYRWQDVVDAIDASKAQDVAKADRSSVRARLRKAGPAIALLESLAGMIPDQDGLSVLRGGLTTLFKVSARLLELKWTDPTLTLRRWLADGIFTP
jgi:hypothetical protein